MRVHTLSDVEAWIGSFPGLHFRGTEAFLGRESVMPSELAHVERSVESRVRDFATGRWCARQALKALGFAEVPIGVGEGREPIWPLGIAGSISHTTGYCCAVVSAQRQSLGIDVQSFTDGLREETWNLICTPEEMGTLGDFGKSLRAIRFGIFSAKEAFYKLIYPEVRRFIHFHDVSIRIQPDGTNVSATLLKDLTPALPAGTLFSGNLFFMPDRCLALFQH